MISPWDLKVQRAEYLLHEFSREVSEYFQLGPAQLEQVQISPTTVVSILHINRQAPTVLASLSGEIIHNLRSALDSLVYNLVLKEAKRKNVEISQYCHGRIQFPIETREENLRHICFLKGLTETKLFQDLESFQPFRWGNGEKNAEMRHRINAGHHLALLRHLSNLDKHQGINFVFCKLQDFYILLPKDLSIMGDIVYEKEFENSKPIFTIELIGSGDFSKVQIVPRFGLSFYNSKYGFPNNSATNQLEALVTQVKFYVQQLSWHLGN